MQPFLKINLNEEGLNKFSGEDSEVVKILFHKLKAALNIYVHNDTIYALGGIGSNGALEGMLTGVGDGKIDMSMNMRPLFVLWKLRYSTMSPGENAKKFLSKFRFSRYFQ